MIFSHDALAATFTFRGTEYPIVFTFGSQEPQDEEGWINGAVTIDGEHIGVGGGWVDYNGRVSPYLGRERGDVASLAAALGAPEDDEAYDAFVEDLGEALDAALPDEWETIEGER